MPTPSSSASKKAKTASDNDDFETVKRYLLECPHVTSENPAIKAALEGIEKEQKRRERDAKLQRKFAQVTTTSSNINLSDSVVVIDTAPTPPTASNDDDPDEMEWQDVAIRKDDDDDDEADGTSFLGKKLAKIAIDSISEHQVKVKSPVAAIAVVIHASLRSDMLGFSCTGVPEDETAKKGGFAPSVRELPKYMLLPPKWDANPDKVSLRYRKHGTGALVLVVQQEAERKIRVLLQPASSKEPPTQLLSFSLEEHVNLDSWNAALKASSFIPPALHYKFLAVLLANFCRAFDLGAVNEAEEVQAATPYVDNTVPMQMGRPIIKSDFVPLQPVPAFAAERRKPWEDGVPATLDQAFPGRRQMPYGDFADDLAPGGLMDPRFAGLPGRMGGNQMGPNHPMFQGGAIHGPPLGGPGSMQPRFDPIYPPGVDVDIDGKPRRNRPSRSGDPNPDHLPPPNAFGGDMFS
jgi:hypothetical protein